MDGDESGSKPLRGRGRGRGRGSRGRGVRGRGGSRGRGKKNAAKAIESDEEDSGQQNRPAQSQTPPVPKLSHSDNENLDDREGVDENEPPMTIDMEADILQLEAPTFTTINRGPPEPMLRLRWDHRVNLVGEKVLNPMIHCCDKCLKPILIYGRMIPCKHVFCLTCAKREDKVCPRCMNKVIRVEHTGLGTVFMCTHDGTRYGNSGCRRTYLSQRDLQAHINHRHISSASAVPTLGVSGVTSEANQDQQSPVLILSTGMGANRLKQPQPLPKPSSQHLSSANDPRLAQQAAVDHHRRNSPPPPPQQTYMQPPHRPPPHTQHPQGMYQPQPNPATGNMRTNLITVQIQDSTNMETAPPSAPPGYYGQHPPHPAQYVPPYAVAPQFYQPGPPPAAYAPAGPPLPPRPPFPEPPHSHPYNPGQWGGPQHPANASQQFYH